ncbi:hypothetical protein EVAR_63004_1 [Eumeta japonica]|uniref:Uncharacterized protein n=1 Tax=Eumeta variegata TaxID=151549 RepID=A0A4C1YVP4_EUMVA|nr:hypothetical protein EVAR_63004_1 [Eumeta japonica]
MTFRHIELHRRPDRPWRADSAFKIIALPQDSRVGCAPAARRLTKPISAFPPSQTTRRSSHTSYVNLFWALVRQNIFVTVDSEFLT